MTEFNNKEVGISLVRSAFSAVPFAGQLLNEVAFEYRGRLKQNRLNKFTELLTEFFIENEDINLASLKSEDFSDLLESVLKRVVQTKSEEKQKRFRDILVNKIKNPNSDIENAEVYLDLISSLNEYEIKVLYYHQVFDNKFDKDKDKLSRLEHELLIIQEKLKKELETKKDGFANDYSTVLIQAEEYKKKVSVFKAKHIELQQFRENNFYNLTKDKFLYYKQSLYSKGLLIDSGIGAIGVRPFQIMSITEFGKEFVAFIMST